MDKNRRVLLLLVFGVLLAASAFLGYVLTAKPTGRDNSEKKERTVSELVDATAKGISRLFGKKPDVVEAPKVSDEVRYTLSYGVEDGGIAFRLRLSPIPCLMPRLNST